jgi:gluconolactonase
MDGIPSPNGMAIDPAGSTLYVCVTRGSCLYRVPIRDDGRVGKVGVHLNLSGGTGGPDGLAVDARGGLAIAHYGLGRVWLFDKHGLPGGHVVVPQGSGTTSLAYGPDDGLLYITESESASVVVAEAAEPGLSLFSHAPATE